MRLISLLSWFDEDVAWLAELVASMARAGVEHVVAVDGAYVLFPQARGHSPSEQAQTVLATAAGAGIGVTVHSPAAPWAGNEVQKRSWLFAAAHLVAEPGRDWLWVCDADEVITAGPNPGELDASPAGAAEVLLVSDDGAHPVRRLFRAHPRGISVQGRHGRYVNGDGGVLWDSCDAPAEVEAANAWSARMRHRSSPRAAARSSARRAYYRRRDAQQLEAA
jgi:hypothetical protein